MKKKEKDEKRNEIESYSISKLNNFFIDKDKIKKGDRLCITQVKINKITRFSKLDAFMRSKVLTLQSAKSGRLILVSKEEIANEKLAKAGAEE